MIKISSIDQYCIAIHNQESILGCFLHYPNYIFKHNLKKRVVWVSFFIILIVSLKKKLL